MDRSETINLISATYTKDSYGVDRKTETSRTVFCNVRSITKSEFYSAGQNGLKPEYQFTVFSYDYENEPIVEYNGNRYSVYRTYKGRNDELELYVQKTAGSAS